MNPRGVPFAIPFPVDAPLQCQPSVSAFSVILSDVQPELVPGESENLLFTLLRAFRMHAFPTGYSCCEARETVA